MKLSIIGAGRVGQTIGRMARDAGYDITDVVCRSRRSAASAVRFIGAGDPQGAARARLSPADIILIATPDDKINDAVKLVSSSAGRIGRAAALHTSGALSSGSLAPLAALGFSVGSCHPLQTFESPARAISRAKASYFCIEGDARAASTARKLVRRIGAKHFEISTEMKGLYHAAAVMASGGVVALVSISLEILMRCGLSGAESKKVLLPLIEGTIANVRTVGPARALTGPVRRGDRGTVEQNMRALAALDPNWLHLYRLLAARSLSLAEEVGLDRRSHAELRRLLKVEGGKQKTARRQGKIKRA